MDEQTENERILAGLVSELNVLGDQLSLNSVGAWRHLRLDVDLAENNESHVYILRIARNGFVMAKSTEINEMHRTLLNLAFVLLEELSLRM